MLQATRTRLTILLLFSAAAVATDAGMLQNYPLTADSMRQWKLPDKLNEISGLAMTADNRLLTVNDEVAIVYEMDFAKGGLIKAFALGNPAVKGDFEGIAVADGLVYLMTSSGRIYLAAEGADGQRVSFDTFDTGLGHNCEFEGLVQSRDEQLLYLLCKGLRKEADVKALTIFAWSIADRQWLRDRSVELPTKDIQRTLDTDRFDPSGLTIDARTGNFIIVAGRQHALVEVTPHGQMVSARVLLLIARHRQAEGIELAGDADLLIADEGGNHRARLAVYRQQDATRNSND